MIQHDCPHCQELQREWYSKLKKFNEIEDIRYENRPLKAWHNSIFKKVTFEEIQDKYDYNDKANELLRRYSFESRTHKKIWELHCEGYTSQEIENEIKHLSSAVKERNIRYIIKQLGREIE